MSEVLGADASRLRDAGVEVSAVEAAAVAIAASLAAGGTLLTVGNGGSAADAQHVSAELLGRFEADRPGWPSIALTTNSSTVTAIGNDFGFEHVFARQVQALARPGDVLLAISTSGRSHNIIAALAVARAARATTIGLVGAADCPLAREANIAICVPGSGSAAIQERHLLVEHCLCRAVETLRLSDRFAARLVAPGSVVGLEQLMAMRAGWRASGRVVVWTNGCFDLVHRGHLHSLEAAKALGDVLVVGVNGDASVRRLKGEGRPLMPAQNRAELLAALRVVDYVTVFDQDTPEQTLGRLQPEIHTKGADYEGPNGKPVPEREIVEAYGGRVEFLPLVPDRSTSGLIGILRATGADGTD